MCSGGVEADVYSPINTFRVAGFSRNNAGERLEHGKLRIEIKPIFPDVRLSVISRLLGRRTGLRSWIGRYLDFYNGRRPRHNFDGAYFNSALAHPSARGFLAGNP